MKNKLISIILAVVFVISCINFTSFATSIEAYAILGSTPQYSNLSASYMGGVTPVVAQYASISGWKLDVSTQTDPYILINVENTFLYNISDYKNVTLSVNYYDDGLGYFDIKYDSIGNASRTADRVYLGDTNAWKTYTVLLEDAYFGGRISGSDIKLCTSDSTGLEPVTFSSVYVSYDNTISPVAISAQTTNTGNILYEADGKTANVTFTNKENSQNEFTVSYSVLDDSDNVVKTITGETITIGANASTERMINIGIGEYGIFSLEITLTNSSDNIYTVKGMPFAICVSNTSLNSDLGANTIFNVSMDETFDIMRKGGFGAARYGLMWRIIETTPGVYQLSSGMNGFLQNANNAGIDVIGILGYGNTLYTDSTSNAVLLTDPDELEAYENYVYNTVNLVAGKVNKFETWNEPLQDTANRTNAGALAFAEMQKRTYENVKAANPDAIIAGVGTHSMSNTQLLDLTEYMLQNGIGEYFDALALHPYCGTQSPEARGTVNQVNNYQGLLDEYGYSNKNIWATEFGWDTSINPSSGTKATEKQQAEWIVRYYTLHKGNDFSNRFFNYTLVDTGVEANNSEHNFGLIKNKDAKLPYEAKPSYLAASFLNKMVGNANSCAKVIAANNKYMYVYNAPRKEVRVLWTTDSSASLTYSFDENTLFYDIYGNLLDLSPEDGTYTLTNSPIYAVIDNSVDEEIAISGQSGIVTITGQTSIADEGKQVNIVVMDPGEQFGLSMFPNAVYMDEATIDSNGEYSFSFNVDTSVTYTAYISRTGRDAKEIQFVGTGEELAAVLIKRNSEIVESIAGLVDNDILNVRVSLAESVVNNGCFLVWAFYKDKVLKNVVFSDTITNSSMNIQGDVGLVSEIDTMKVFLWDSFANMKPIIDSKVIA